MLVTSWLVTICGIDMPASWNSIAWCPLSFGPTCCRSTCSKDSMSLETKLVFQVKSQQAKNIIQVQQSNKKKDVYRALFAQFYRLSGIFAHPVGTGSTSNNSRSWIPFLMGSLHIQSEQGPTSNNFRSWTQVLLCSERLPWMPLIYV